MSDIISYVKKYGHKSFAQMPLNEIDILLLTSLTYLDYADLVSAHVFGKKRLADVAMLFTQKYDKKVLNKSIIAVQAAGKILNSVRQSIRFQDCLMYNYVYKYNNEKQFSALFIDVDNHRTIVAFEGTDDLISGWKEDFALCYEFPIPSQKEAIRYVNTHISPFASREYIFAGHSKGGNLALVAGMYANPLIKKNIKRIISFDGPGLKQKQISSRQYAKMAPLYQLIIPNYSVVGLLLRHPDNYHVILSNKKGIMAHNFLSWQVIDEHFVVAKLSHFSEHIDHVITDWLDKYNDTERREFVMDLFAIFERANIDSLLDIKENVLKNVHNILKESTQVSEHSKVMIRDFLNFIMEYLRDDALSLIPHKDK